MYLNNFIITFLIFCSFIIITPSTFAKEKSPQLDIKTYLNNIRQEFIELSKTEGKGELPLYIEKIHIEMNVGFSVEGEAGVKVYVLDLRGKVAKDLTQKLSFDVYLGGRPGRVGLLTSAGPRAGWGYTGGAPDVMMAMDASSFLQKILDRLENLEDQLKKMPKP